MTDETGLLAEMLLQADILCARVESGALATNPPGQDEIRLKICQCKGAIARLQSSYEEDRLTLEDQCICAEFRNLLMSLMWVCFYGQAYVDRKLFRKLVQIESGFSYLMMRRGRPAPDPSK